MSVRAEQTLAQVWHRAVSRKRQPEGFLEDALAAAMEHPGVWPKFCRHAGWDKRLPLVPPTVTTQDSEDEDRTDVRLSWASGKSLIIELKAWTPLRKGQLDRYRRRASLVAAIAPYPAYIEMSNCLGVLTWQDVHLLDWADAPLPWRQLLNLIDAIGVAMPRVDLPALTGLVQSWNAYPALDSWILSARTGITAALREREFPCVLTRTTRKSNKLHSGWQRYVTWIYPEVSREQGFRIQFGLFVGRPDTPTLVPGLPDLVLCLHMNPKGKLSQGLADGSGFTEAVERWTGRGGCREHRHEAWERLMVRDSTVSLLQEPEDQGKLLVAWMVERSLEWADDGVLEAVSASASREGQV